jgi:hypothetical protein
MLADEIPDTEAEAAIWLYQHMLDLADAMPRQWLLRKGTYAVADALPQHYDIPRERGLRLVT